MHLDEVMKNIEYRIVNVPEKFPLIQGIAYDSRKIEEGFLFVCITGFKMDGHQFVKQAMEKGAKFILAEREVEVNPDVTLLITTDCRKALPVISGNFYKHPSRELNVVGVTGTNGKTTTTHLIQAILQASGKKTGIMGTLYARYEKEERNLGHTTPESLEIEEFMDAVRRGKGDYVVMEVSSHALDLRRVNEISYHSAVFTNLTQDHLDYHVTMEQYRDSKLKLFQGLLPEKGNFAIVNGDDPFAADFIKACSVPCYTYGMKKDADIKAVNVKTSLKGTRFTVKANGKQYQISMKLIGLFSVYNALAAISYALMEGVDPEIIVNTLSKLEGVAGRFEQVDMGQDFTVVVDYAHTPDGLENILKTGRELAENRMITVFGCGGDRDRTKRPIMGRIAAEISDFCIVTSDNPRTEDPEAIINEIIAGVEKVPNVHYAKIIDRRDAIQHALVMAKKGDLIIIAGKGHETYQLVKDQVLHFDDREVVREFLKGM